MSLYRQARGRRVWPLALIGVLAAALGFGAGALVFSDEEEPSVAEAIVDLRAELTPARSALELVRIEYPQAVDHGKVVSETELGAARSQAETALGAVEAAKTDLDAIDPRRADHLVRTLERLVDAIDALADPGEVKGVSRIAEGMLNGLVGRGL